MKVQCLNKDRRLSGSMENRQLDSEITKCGHKSGIIWEVADGGGEDARDDLCETVPNLPTTWSGKLSLRQRLTCPRSYSELVPDASSLKGHLRTPFNVTTFQYYNDLFQSKPMMSQKKTVSLAFPSFTFSLPFSIILNQVVFCLGHHYWGDGNTPASTGLLPMCSAVLLENRIPAWYRCRLHPFSTHLLFLFWLTASGLFRGEQGEGRRGGCGKELFLLLLCQFPACWSFRTDRGLSHGS